MKDLELLEKKNKEMKINAIATPMKKKISQPPQSPSGEKKPVNLSDKIK